MSYHSQQDKDRDILIMKNIIKVGVHSEYFKPQDIWSYCVWAQIADGDRYYLREWSGSFVLAQDQAENLLGTNLDSSCWDTADLVW